MCLRDGAGRSMMDFSSVRPFVHDALKIKRAISNIVQLSNAKNLVLIPTCLTIKTTEPRV